MRLARDLWPPLVSSGKQLVSRGDGTGQVGVLPPSRLANGGHEDPLWSAGWRKRTRGKHAPLAHCPSVGDALSSWRLTVHVVSRSAGSDPGGLPEASKAHRFPPGLCACPPPGPWAPRETVTCQPAPQQQQQGGRGVSRERCPWQGPRRQPRPAPSASAVAVQRLRLSH